jgi:multiple sugar transport system permease protein
MAGYALTRFRYYWPGLKWKNNNIAFFIISQRMLPAVVVILPYMIMYRIFGLIDTHLGMILAYTVFNLPFAVWILRDFFAGLPVDLEESALIDGANRFQVFRALTLVTPRTQTVQVAMAMTEGSTISPYNLQMAASLLTVAVPLLFFLLLGRYFIRGVLAGALKG